MQEHYDWAVRLHSTGVRECYHLAVAQIETEKKDNVESRITAMLAKCLKCDYIVAINENYRRTDRTCGDQSIYIRQLFR